MSLTYTQQLALYRLYSNDNDANNPIITDANLAILHQEWQKDIAGFLGFPVDYTGNAKTSAGANGFTTFPTDFWSVLKAVWIRDASGGVGHELLPTTIEDLVRLNPNWQNEPNGVPRNYFFDHDRNFRYWPSNSETDKTLGMYFYQIPAAISGASAPAFNQRLHMTGVYFLCWQGSMRVNRQKADYYRNLYLEERKRLRNEGNQSEEYNRFRWDTGSRGRELGIQP